ncbi:hypothetical protein J5N97_028246 [Dioscorea zingiberensis]|uniref:Reticulon-like protein n=1 Tax=Dioscorea zingiberensis TaxID=325984 RepID=A0A9D5H4N4_9LILI|nr:hypothetical protein J5N97_028246 [Dioscorea zingiberensis]
MDSSDPATPPSDRSEPRLRPKSASRLAHNFEDPMDPSTIKSPLRGPIPLQDLLLLSPSSSHPPKPYTDADDYPEPASGIVPRKKKKSSSHLPLSCASPRSARRARRRLEKEIIRDERDLACSIDDDLVKQRKRRQSSKPRASRKEKLPLVSPLPPPSPLPKIVDEDNCSSVDDLLERILELILWKNVAKSTLWFGFGSMFFLSSWFSRDVSFSFISAISHLSILVLALAFFCDSFSQCSKQNNWRRDFKLTEEDVLRVSRVVLPVANAALVKAQGIFSGEPLMTLKVVPVLLFGAKFGHLITPWRLFATGFFLIFTAPKLYSCYSHQIHRRGESIRNYIWEAWSSCQHKKLVGGSAAILLWNLFGVKARIFVAFISMVLLRYHHQQPFLVEENVEKELQGELQQALITAE